MTIGQDNSIPGEQLNFLQSIIDTVREPVLVLENSLRIVLASRSFYNTFKTSPEIAQGIPIHELDNGLWDIPALRRLLNEVVTQGIEFNGYEIRHEFAGQGERILTLSVRKLQHPDNPTGMLLLAVNDVTERTRTEEHLRTTAASLRTSEERYRTLFETVDEGFCVLEMIFDAQDKPLDYRFLEVNPAFERHTGLVNSVGKTVRELVPDLDDSWFQLYGGVALTGVPVRFENYAPAMNRWFDVYAQRVGAVHERKVALLFNNITTRKQTEEALRVASARNERIAETLQHSLLLAPAPDAYPGVTIEAVYHSAWDDAQVGGDFFDVFAVDENRIALVVGDATGKGLEAATYTAEIKFALRAFLRVENGNAATSLTRLSEFIIRNDSLDAGHNKKGSGVGGSYVALALSVLNTDTGEAICACAGAEPPIVISAIDTGNEPTIREISAFGPLLGVADGASYQEQDFQLRSGDLLVLTSDGITESRRPRDSANKSGAFFGLDGLAKATIEALSISDAGNDSIDSAVSSSPSRVGDYVVQQARAWAGGVQHDDICLLFVRRR